MKVIYDLERRYLGKDCYYSYTHTNGIDMPDSGSYSFPTGARGICTTRSPSSPIPRCIVRLAIGSIYSISPVSGVSVAVGIGRTVLTVLRRGWAKCWRSGTVCWTSGRVGRTRRRVHRAGGRVRWRCRTELWTRWSACQLILSTSKGKTYEYFGEVAWNGAGEAGE
jgi:hypothetical protein